MRSSERRQIAGGEGIENAEPTFNAGTAFYVQPIPALPSVQ